MAIIELLFIVVKIIVLSSIYTTVLLLIVLFLSKMNKLPWAKKVLTKKLRFWLLTHFIISVFLFVIVFSYWQDTGIGDNSKIPVGYGQTIQSEDFESTYFYPYPDKTETNKDELIIGNYKIAGHLLCAEVSHQFSNSPDFDFLVYDLKNKKLDKFYSESEYSSYATKHSLPMQKDFYDFRQHYHEFLDKRPKWKTWLLP